MKRGLTRQHIVVRMSKKTPSFARITGGVTSERIDTSHDGVCTGHTRRLSDIDGRSERDVIESWVSEIEAPTGKTLEQWRQQLDICADGNGHWAGFRWGHCRESDCPTEWANEVRWRAEDEARKAVKEGLES